MIVQLDQIKSIIKAGRPEWLKCAIKEAEKLNVHINGVGTAEYLNKILKFENELQFKVRKQLVTSNRFLFENISRPIDKVFSASGGSRVYPATNKVKIEANCNNVRHGYSIRQWCKNVQKNKYLTEPNGLTFMEWNTEKTYPTIKPVSSLLNYSSDGRLCDWVCFTEEVIGEERFIRFVDDAFDYLLKIEGETITIVEDKTYPNVFKKCPAIINSDIIHYELNRHDSPFAPIVELADHYLRTGSVKNIYENYHGYPIFWAYGQPCKNCKGEGSVKTGDATTGQGQQIVKCPVCDGERTSLRKDVTDIIMLKHDPDAQSKIAPDVAGYVQPDLETWREQRAELKDLKEEMMFAIWGTTYTRDKETATANYLDVVPVKERQSMFSDAFEDMELKITEFISLYYNKNSKGVSINWGKRFNDESPDSIWKRYIEAKAAGANKTTLDYLLKSFYQSEYASDNERLNESMKMIRLEPFVHLTEKECVDNGIIGSDLIAKQYFKFDLSKASEKPLSFFDALPSLLALFKNSTVPMVFACRARTEKRSSRSSVTTTMSLGRSKEATISLIFSSAVSPAVNITSKL